MYRSTIEGVDPSKPRSTYDGMKAELAAWDAMQADWRSLGRGHAVYAEMRDAYKKIFEDLKSVINNTMT